MGTHGQVLLNDVFGALNDCLPGWSKTEGRHNLSIKGPNGTTYPGFPSGAHGKRPGRAAIQKGHVRDLFEFFGVIDCAKKHLQILG
jgi:hypothetical protein